MTQILRGNFNPKRSPLVAEPEPDDLTTRFEAEALKRLGGSIAFVSKKKFTLGLDTAAPEPAISEGVDGPAGAPNPS
jgi:hypothetical protein